MTLNEAENAVVELFGALAGAPDDRVIAEDADEALHSLDMLLAGELPVPARQP